MASAVPHLIGHQIDLSREAAKLDRRSLTEEERAQWYGVTGAGRLYWSHFTVGGKGGAELFQEGIERLQLNGPAPAVPTTPEEKRKYNAEMQQKAAEAEAIMNQAMTLAAMGRIGDPVAFAERLDKLQLTRRPRDKMALANEDFVFERLQAKYPDATPEQIQAAVRLKDSAPGAITSKEIVAAAVGDVASPRTTKYLGAKVQEWSRAHGSEAGAQLWQGQNQLQPDELEYIRRRRAGQTPRQAIKSPGEWNPNPEGIPSYGPPRTLNISADQQARLDRLFRAESGDSSALSGMTPRDVPAHQLAAVPGASTYQFTSITGLAEKMQTEASGALDVATQQLQVLERIATNTERQPVEHPNSPASAPTHLAPYHQHH
jgi:DNA-binding TFAR19-related protein (PDSD5 family)